MNNKRIALALASIIGLAGLSYLGYWYYRKMRTSSGNAQKDDREIQIVRTDK